MYTYFPRKSLGMDVVNILVIHVICRSRTHLNPQTICLPQTPPFWTLILSFAPQPVEPILTEVAMWTLQQTR